MEPTISVVLPVFNEAENLPVLTGRLVPVLERSTGGSFEVIFVDDGSSDASAEIIEGLHAADPRIKAIHFSRNFGHQAALQAGLDEAAGRGVVLMDADMQDPPEVIEAFVAKWREGHDVVYAVRKTRQDSFFKRATSALFYRSLKVVADVDLPVDSGDFCLLDRRVVRTLVGLSERNRYLRGLRSWVGFRQVGVEFERDLRYAGAAKYSFRDSLRLALTGYIGFSIMPLRVATWLGFAAACTGFGVALWAIAGRLLDVTVRGWASTIAIVLFVGGVQLVVLGVLGEYLGRVYDEVRRRPAYIVQSRLGLVERGAAGDRPPP